MSKATHGPAADPGGHGTASGEGGQNNRNRTFIDQWNDIERKHPGLMDDLYEEFVHSFTGDSENRSLLSEIHGEQLEEKILSKLVGERADNYTEKLSSVFIGRFTEQQQMTSANFGPYDPIYVRLAATDPGEAPSDSNPDSESGFDSESKPKFDGEDVIMDGPKEKRKNPIAQKKALQVVLAYNYFVRGEKITWGNHPCKMSLGDGTSVLLSTASLFSPLIPVFNALFDIFEALQTGVSVKAVREHQLANGGRVGIGVVVSGSMTDDGHLQPVKEYAAIIELKRPNAGFGVAWKLLNGQGWTPEELSAFFELSRLSLGAFGGLGKAIYLGLEAKLKLWQKDTVWTAAGEVLGQIRSRRVDVKYSIAPKSGQSESGKPEYGNNKAREYFIIGDGYLKFITTLLSTSKLKNCLDSVLNAIAQASTYAAPKGCTRIAIVDMLTVVTGSAWKLEKSGNAHSNPGNYDDVIDVHLHDTAMMQTHDENSALYMLEYCCEAAMSNIRLRDIGDYLISTADHEYQGGEITDAGREKVIKRVQMHNFSFNSQNHSSKDLTLVESSKVLSIRARGHVLQALADFDMSFPGIKSRAAQFNSDTFAICEWFREDAFEGAETGEPWHGRSRSVAKVLKRGDSDGKLYVMKEYFADELSVSRMKRELEAYARISRLPSNERKRVAELVSFGSLDLDTGDPRLYLLLEYVEDIGAEVTDPAYIQRELTIVDMTLRSVGVCHNDIEPRNYRWQLRLGGNWYIKVFDFDHATFIEVPKKSQMLPMQRTKRTRIQPVRRRRTSL